ncbi:MAG: DUF799 family lipoprotein [Nitrospirae bacterium]|nr:DUF799 family lipoprotein [Nitrospirota bacterium]MCL5236798.1 DUF799 family lipoprotein [Nitrospirota bacterium]
MISKAKSTRDVLLSLVSTFVAFLLLTPLISGCTGAMKYYTRPEFSVSSLKRIAVLPLENYSTDGYAGEKIRKAVITEMLSRGVDVIEPGEITRALNELKVQSRSSLSVKELQGMQKMLGVDAVLTGSVESFGMSTGISATYPEVSIHLVLLDAGSGTILWSVWRTSGGANFWTRHFGAEGASLSETARKVVKGAIDTLF